MRIFKKLLISCMLLCVVLAGKAPVSAQAAWKSCNSVEINGNWYGGVTNSGDFYYTEKNVLYKGTVTSTGVKVADLSSQLSSWAGKDNDMYTHVSGGYGDTLYIDVTDEMSKMDIYAYDLKKQTLSKAVSGMNIMNFSGKYFLLNARQHSDVSPNSSYLFKASASGLKKLKYLGYTMGETFIGDQIYYGKFTSLYPLNKMSVCRIKKNGTGKKTLATKSVSGQYASLYPAKITKSYCEVRAFDNGNQSLYRYTYATKKWKKIS